MEERCPNCISSVFCPNRKPGNSHWIQHSNPPRAVITLEGPFKPHFGAIKLFQATCDHYRYRHQGTRGAFRCMAPYSSFNLSISSASVWQCWTNYCKTALRCSGEEFWKDKIRNILRSLEVQLVVHQSMQSAGSELMFILTDYYHQSTMLLHLRCYRDRR